MFLGSKIRATVAVIPGRNLLVIRGICACRIADARRRLIQRFEVSTLTEAAPDGLAGCGCTAAGLCGLNEQATTLRAAGQLAVAIGEDAVGSGVADERAEEEDEEGGR